MIDGQPSNPLRERAEIILQKFQLAGMPPGDRLLQLLSLSDVDLEVLFTQEALGPRERHNDFDVLIEMLVYRIPYGLSKGIAEDLRQNIIHTLENKNWKAAIALMIKALDNGN